MAIEKVYTDIKYGFEKNSAGDISPVYNESSINQSLLSLFNTSKGERFFNLNYGTNIKKLLFEPLDSTTANQIIKEIRSAIDFYEGIRIEILGINTTIDYDSNQYIIDIEYRIKSTTETATLNLILPKG